MKTTPHFKLRRDYMFIEFIKILILIVIAGGNLILAEEKAQSVSKENAAFYYNKAFKKIEDFQVVGNRAKIGAILKNGWGGEDHFKDYIKKDRGIISLVRKAGHYYECNFDKDRKYSLKKNDISHLSKARKLARFLMLKKRYFEFKGDCKKAVECLIMTKTLANHLSQEPPMISHSISFAVRNLSNIDIDFIFDCPIDVQKGLLKKILISDSKRTPVWKLLMWQQRSLYNTLNEIFADCIIKEEFKNISLKPLIKKKKKEEILSDWKPILNQNLKKVWGELTDSLCIQPYSEVKQVINEIDKSTLNMKRFQNDLKKMIKLIKENKSKLSDDAINNYIGDKISRILIATYWAPLKRLIAENYLNVLRERAVILKIALKIYKNERGEYPKGLSALVPKYLPFYPLDPYNGMPLKYNKDKDGCMFYSVGPDIKDSKGEQKYEPQRIMLEGDLQGDIVYELH